MPPDALPMSRRTAVVMMDTRVPDLVNLARRWDATDQPMKHNALDSAVGAQFLNLKYACAHGYSLIFYQLVGHGCRHPLWGQRHPSYCKLAAVAETLAAGYGWVVCVDSDAFFQSTGSKTFLELRALLRAYGATAEDAAGNGARALFGWDAPYTFGPNAGFMVLRNSPETRELAERVVESAVGRARPRAPVRAARVAVAARPPAAVPRARGDALLADDGPELPGRGRAPGPQRRHQDANVWVMARAAAELLAPTVRRAPEAVVAAAPAVSRQNVVRQAREGGGRRRPRRRRRFGEWHAAQWRRRVRGRASPIQRDGVGAAPHGDAARARASLLLGLPLEIRNCSEHALDAPWQSWVLTEGPRRPHRRGGGSSRTDVLMVDDHPPTNSSTEEPHRSRCAPTPHVCLHVERRARSSRRTSR